MSDLYCGHCQIIDYTLAYRTMRPMVLRRISEEKHVGKPAIITWTRSTVCDQRRLVQFDFRDVLCRKP